MKLRGIVTGTRIPLLSVCTCLSWANLGHGALGSIQCVPSIPPNQFAARDLREAWRSAKMGALMWIVPMAGGVSLAAEPWTIDSQADWEQGAAARTHLIIDGDLTDGAIGTKGSQMSVAWFTSASLDEQFEFCGHIGVGHPDPDICVAKGRFYLAPRMSTGFVSPGPWVERVEVRIGSDTDHDAAIDQWSNWAEIKEHYDHTPGFAKHVKRTPARLDLAGLSAGFGFQFELRLTDTTENTSKPIVDGVSMTPK